jgi:hypothetical protein
MCTKIPETRHLLQRVDKPSGMSPASKSMAKHAA